MTSVSRRRVNTPTAGPSLRKNRAVTEHTGETRPQAPAGWYRDPEDARHLRWWNGHEWQQRAPLPGTTVVTPIGRGFRRLSQVLGSLLVFDLLLSGAQVALYLWGVADLADAVRLGDVETAETFDGLNVVLTVGDLLAVLVAGVVWMTWQYQLARAIQGLDRSPSMHAFSWIIPFGNLWLPFQNVRDLWRRILPLRDTLVVGWWWAAWIATNVIARLFIRDDEIDSAGDVRSTMWTLLVLAAISLIATMLAIHVVRSLARAAWTSEQVSREDSLAA
jgi:hypothetical protein